MKNHRSKESIKFSRSLLDPENAEELQRTKTDIEKSIKQILKLIKKDGSTEKIELVGRIEFLHKQHQSLYALYDRVAEEYGKIAPRRRNRRASMSSSGSESEYFSSEEVDGNKRRSERVHHDDRGDNREVIVYNPSQKEISVGNTNEVLQTTEVEERLSSLMNEKRYLEIQVENQAVEVKELNRKNTELQDQVKELELSLEEQKGFVSDMQEKLNNNKNEANSIIAKLMAQVDELQHKAKSLQTQNDEMQEQIKFDKNEASTQREELMKQLKVMQEKLDSAGNQKKELEAEIERERKQISEHMAEIEKLKEKLSERISVEESMAKEKEGFVARMKDLELELEAQSSQKNELEEQVRETSYEMKQLADENKALMDRNHELRAAMTQRGEEISGFLRGKERRKNDRTLMETMSLKQEINAMRLEVDSLQEQKKKLEQQKERNEKEYAERLGKIEDLNAKLTSQIADQAATIDRISGEHKEAIVMSNKFKLNQRWSERKMEELAEEFRRKMEDNIRLLHQRIHVAEQLNNENKNSCKMTKLRYEEENKILGEKVGRYEEELRAVKTGSSVRASELAISDMELLDFELAVLNGKVEEQREYILHRVSKIVCEVQFAKDWMKKKNRETKEMRENMEAVKDLLNKKEEQEFVLREKVWNLEAKVSKEGGEKLNLTKAVSQLEKKVGKLEKKVKEKDEELIGLGEKKREAIRQLCFVVDFHRDRFNYLKTLLTTTNRTPR